MLYSHNGALIQQCNNATNNMYAINKGDSHKRNVKISKTNL